MFKTINGGQLPQRATKYSAGFDVFANEDVVIGAGETKVIGLGICLDTKEIDKIIDLYAYQKSDDRAYFFDRGRRSDFSSNLYLELHPRSSLRVKGLGGGVGIIDMDYRDEIKMVITNPLQSKQVVENGCNYEVLEYSEDYEYTIKKGDKIGQLILKRHEGWLLSAEYTKDEERNGGFGSTS